MRISDWSSDVCSSDLNEVDYESVEFIATMLRQHLTEQEVAADQHWLNPEMEGQGASYAWPVAQLLGGVYQAWDESPHCVDELEKRLLARQEIGRASCRERVCKYV